MFRPERGDIVGRRCGLNHHDLLILIFGDFDGFKW